MSGRFDPPDHLSAVAKSVWRDIIAESDTPHLLIGQELGAYCECVALERDASARVVEEGTIVADERGRPIPHPAIAVARGAQADLRSWGDRFK